jgi:hypothetical protein
METQYLAKMRKATQICVMIERTVFLNFLVSIASAFTVV